MRPGERSCRSATGSTRTDCTTRRSTPYGTVRAIRGYGDSSARSRVEACDERRPQHPTILDIGDDMDSSLDIGRDVKHALRMTSLFDITGS